jgi:hypothetical protein
MLPNVADPWLPLCHVQTPSVMGFADRPTTLSSSRAELRFGRTAVMDHTRSSDRALLPLCSLFADLTKDSPPSPTRIHLVCIKPWRWDLGTLLGRAIPCRDSLSRPSQKSPERVIRSSSQSWWRGRWFARRHEERPICLHSPQRGQTRWRARGRRRRTREDAPIFSPFPHQLPARKKMCCSSILMNGSTPALFSKKKAACLISIILLTMVPFASS